MNLLSRPFFAPALLVAAALAAVPGKAPGEDRVTRVFEVPSHFLPESPRKEVVAMLANLGSLIGEPDNVVYDSLKQRLVARSTVEKLDQIEAILE